MFDHRPGFLKKILNGSFFSFILYSASTFFLFSLGSFWNPPLHAQTRPAWLDEDVYYAWPTNASYYMSSSFGETRSAHFHAAMDIGTWGHEGYAVFATRDGIVDRISISPSGYGNVIYLRHNDGSASLYAHLKDFHPHIRHVVDSLRLIDYSFRFDENLASHSIRFRQGEQIGWTGSTGVGPPHFHFELRSPDGHPFNPKLAGVKIKDTIPPQFSSLAVEPLSPVSRINGSPSIYRSRPHRQRGKIDFGTIETEGEVGLAVNVFDQANASNNVHAVYGLKMYVNDQLYFYSRADSFSYAQSRQLFLDRVYPLLIQERRGYQRLYIREANTLPFYRDTGYTGRLDLPEGIHQIRIVAYDFYGNRTEAHLRMNVSPALPPNIQTGIEFPDGYVRSRPVLDPFISGSSLLNGNKSAGDGNERPIANKPPALFYLPANKDSVFLSGLSKMNRLALKEAPFPLSVSGLPLSSEPLPENLIWAKDWVHTGLHQSEKEKSEKLSIRALGSFWKEKKQHTTTDAFLPVDFSDRMLFKKGDNAWILHRISPDSPATLYHENMRVSIHFPLHSFFEPVTINLSGTYPEFSLSPDTEPFRRRATVRIKLDETMKELAGIGLYRVNPRNGRLSHVSSRVDVEKRELSGHLFSFGTYRIERDSIPPEISAPGIQRWRHNNRPYAVVRVNDELSGIDPDTAVFIVNGQRGIAEYDPDKNLLRYHHPDFRPAARNEIVVQISDRAGNKTAKTFTNVRYN